MSSGGFSDETIRSLHQRFSVLDDLLVVVSLSVVIKYTKSPMKPPKPVPQRLYVCYRLNCRRGISWCRLMHLLCNLISEDR
ncbi:unnamed protein product [Brassica oleracea]